MRGDDLSEAFDLVRPEAPRYCPRCRRDADPDTPLCADCGETVLPQSYCPVCESYWRQPAGTDCPKHDLPLEDGPPVSGYDPAWGSVANWVTVATFTDAQAAEPARLRLDAEGIPTFLEGARMGGQSMYLVATGGVKLQVPQALADDARILLSQSWSLPTAPDDLDDAWEELAPESGRRRRTVMKGALIVLLFGPLLLGLIGWLIERGFRIAP